MLFLLSEQVRPEGVLLTCRLTVELNPFRVARVMVAVPEDPAWKAMGPEFEIVKSGVVEAAMLMMIDFSWLV